MAHTAEYYRIIYRYFDARDALDVRELGFAECVSRSEALSAEVRAELVAIGDKRPWPPRHRPRRLYLLPGEVFERPEDRRRRLAAEGIGRRCPTCGRPLAGAVHISTGSARSGAR